MTDKLARTAWSAFLSVADDHPVVSELVAVSQVRNVGSNHHVINQAGASDFVYLVHRGSLSAIKFTMNGHEILLSDIVPGDLVGELSVLAGTERSSAVISTSSSKLISIDAGVFERFCVQFPALSAAVMRQLARRLIRTSTVLSEQISLSVPSRLYGELVRIGRPSAEDEEVLVIEPAPTITGLARKIHATREATSRAMTVLQTRGLVQRSTIRLHVILPR